MDNLTEIINQKLSLLKKDEVLDVGDLNQEERNRLMQIYNGGDYSACADIDQTVRGETSRYYVLIRRISDA